MMFFLKMKIIESCFMIIVEMKKKLNLVKTEISHFERKDFNGK